VWERGIEREREIVCVSERERARVREREREREREEVRVVGIVVEGANCLNLPPSSYVVDGHEHVF